MRVLMVTHYFPPETGAPQARLSELASSWARAGDEVTVLTGMPNHPTGVIPPPYRRRLVVDERTDGYRVLRTWLFATPNEGMVRKTLGHLSFALSALLLGGLRVGRPEVVIVSSPTFLSIFSGWALARFHRARFVVEVRDLWPAIFVQLGVLTNRRLIAWLEWLELRAYRAADLVVVVTEGFRDDLLRRGVPGDKVEVVTNGVDLALFRPTAPDPELRARLGAGDGETLVLYVGAHGISHGLVSVADAAAHLRGTSLRFGFVGEGAAKRELAERVATHQLDSVRLLPGVPREEVPRVLAAADVCLVPLRDVPLFSTFIPSKMFECLAAGRAVVGAVRGEAAQILTTAGAVVVPPEDSAALAAALERLAASPSTRAEMAGAGRAHVEAHWDREVLALRYRALLASLTPVPR